MRSLRWTLPAYALMSVLQLAGLASGQRVLSVGGQCLLMPVLALTAVRLPVRRDRIWCLAALAASWFGDTAPRFLSPMHGLPLMMGGFAMAQLCWLVAFWPTAAEHGRRWLFGAGCAVVPSVVLVALCLPGAGALTPAVVGYALLLLGMVTSAATHGRLGILGGALVWVSDAILALTLFVPAARRPPWTDLAVMATYIAAEALLVLALLLSASRDGSPAVESGPAR